MSTGLPVGRCGPVSQGVFYFANAEGYGVSKTVEIQWFEGSFRVFLERASQHA